MGERCASSLTTEEGVVRYKISAKPSIMSYDWSWNGNKNLLKIDGWATDRRLMFGFWSLLFHIFRSWLFWTRYVRRRSGAQALRRSAPIRTTSKSYVLVPCDSVRMWTINNQGLGRRWPVMVDWSDVQWMRWNGGGLQKLAGKKMEIANRKGGKNGIYTTWWGIIIHGRSWCTNTDKIPSADTRVLFRRHLTEIHGIKYQSTTTMAG